MKQKTQSEVTVNESRHTPGEWEYDSIRCEIRGGLKTKGMPFGINKIAIVNQGGLNNPGGDAKSNARLIAAAPDMLEALKDIKVWYDQLTPKGIYNVGGSLLEDAIKKSDSAIAKATNSK